MKKNTLIVFTMLAAAFPALAQSEVKVPAELSGWMSRALELNDTLIGLPALPLVLVGCIAFGYMLKVVPVYPNKWIPLGVFAFGIVSNAVLTTDIGPRSIVRGLILGMVAGGLAILAHRKLLTKWIDDKVFISGDDGGGGGDGKLPAIALAAMISLGTTGCATLSSPTAMQRITTGAKVAAYVGTKEYLREHPGDFNRFADAIRSLDIIINSDTVDAATLMAVLNQLPVKELKSDRAQMLITAATIIISDQLGPVMVDQLKNLKPVAVAVRDGIALAGVVVE